MIFADLLLRLDAKLAGKLLCGSIEDTLRIALAGEHPVAELGEYIAMMVEWYPIKDSAQEVERSQLVNALGPLRRKMMSDDMSAQSIAVLLNAVRFIDAAFDDEIIEKASMPELKQ